MAVHEGSTVVYPQLVTTADSKLRGKSTPIYIVSTTAALHDTSPHPSDDSASSALSTPSTHPLIVSRVSQSIPTG